MTLAAKSDTASIRCVLGLDGGGSKTEAVIASVSAPDNALTEIARVRTGPGNLLASERSIENVEQALELATKAARSALSSEPYIDSACLCLAGTGREEVLSSWRRWSDSRRIATKVQITDDVEPILRQCNEHGAAVGLIAGTGSIAVGRTEAGVRVRCGGWGPPWSDEGSGYSIATRALRLAGLHEDRRKSIPSIHRASLQYFGVHSFNELVAELSACTRQEIAGLAETIVRLADDDLDTEAQQLLRDAAIQLADLVEGVTRQLRAQPMETTLPLGMAGGILLHSSHVRGHLQMELKKRDLRYATIAVEDPAWQAARLAWDRC